VWVWSYVGGGVVGDGGAADCGLASGGSSFVWLTLLPHYHPPARRHPRLSRNYTVWLSVLVTELGVRKQDAGMFGTVFQLTSAAGKVLGPWFDQRRFALATHVMLRRGRSM
jgi:hypothetical protein